MRNDDKANLAPFPFFREAIHRLRQVYEQKKDKHNIVEHLSGLYLSELDGNRDDTYLTAHANRNSMKRQVDVFMKYRRFLKSGSRVLDWGCNHAPDSAMIQYCYGDSIELHGCDYREPDCHKCFHGASRLEYKQLSDPTVLPYESGSFDVIIASGVIEHVCMDFESLKELHRILKEDGILVITFLPNLLSYTEFISRRVHSTHHTRLYGYREISRSLTHYGFVPFLSGYHQFLPAQKFQSIMKYFWFINGFLEKLWPINRFCSNIYVISRKRLQM